MNSSSQSFRPLNSLASALAVGISTLAIAASSLAVQPQTWQHQTPADFNQGKLDNAVVTSFGDLKPATQSRDIGKLEDDLTVIHAIYALEDDLYIAAGPRTTLLKRDGDEIEKILSLEGEQIFWLGEWEGRPLVAVSGEETSRLAVLDGEELDTLMPLPEDVRYIWDVITVGRIIYVATGTEGRVLRLNPAARRDADRIKVVLDAPQSNILRLAKDANGRLYAGTDTDGLVYRISLEDVDNPSVFVMLDANEPEIGSLIAMPDGTIYVGTADASQARPGSMLRPREGDEGRAETLPATPDAPPPAPEPIDAPDQPEAERPVEPAPENAQDSAAPEAPDHPTNDQEQAAPSEPEADGQPDDAPANGADEPATENQSWGRLGAQGHLSPRDMTLQQLTTALNAAEGRAAPTPEQRDALRQEIRRRLEQARGTGAVITPAQQPGQPAAARPPSTPTRPTAAQPQRPSTQGNAIYRISPEGFVTEMFRDSVMILNMMPHDGHLIVATGNDGRLFRINRDEEEYTTLISLTSQQIQSVAQGTRDGKPILLLGASNPARLVELDQNPAERGQFTSQVLDASQISLWGVLQLGGRIPEGTVIEVRARSGNVSDPALGTWADWTRPIALAPNPDADPLAPREVRFPGDELPPARYFQYRLDLTSNDRISPAVQSVTMNYIVPNMRPKVASIKAEYPAPQRPGQQRPGQAPASPTEPTQTLRVQWQASDPNGDRLVYTLQHQVSGSTRWLTLAENITDTNFNWDTRRVPDGRYRLRITASDSPDNPPGMELTASRISEVVVVDNTPPTIERPEVRITPPSVTMRVRVSDELSGPKAFHYSLNDSDTWIPALPEDLIFDSTTETVIVTIPDLSPGPHVVTLRAADGQGNTTFRAVNITMPATGK
ncbi:MAG: hypothetical protein JJU36_09875 [Phycisphaeraceae bacterium]|nr:hypothetical protein [Phycisphaeraceae bacterium]